MCRFIEIIDTDGKRQLINTDCIFRVAVDCNELEICLCVNGFHDFPYQYIRTRMKYEAFRELIDSPHA